MDTRRHAVLFDSYYFEKLAQQGVTAQRETIFRDIYARHHWAGSASASGAGAAPEQIQTLRAELPPLLKQLRIGTLLDLPCGDYSWMHTLDLAARCYIGGDLLPELIADLAREYGDARHQFRVVDLTCDALPNADLLLCRDCLVHLSYADSHLAVTNVVRSGIPYFLATTFPSTLANEDIVTGDWRPINLERLPFGFPPPLKMLNEGCTEASGLFADKSLGLWRVADLARLPWLVA